MSETHDWLLVAPWYRWPRQRAESGVPPRATRPVLQKYEEATLVALFQDDPQRSLAWNDDDWVYQLAVLEARKVASGFNKGKVADQAVHRNGRFERYLATKTAIRKLFLPTHKRFYLVVCELHCDAPGFPTATRRDVCQAGFVVRRSFTSYPKSAEGEAAAILKRISALQFELAKLDRLPSSKRALKRWETFSLPSANGSGEARKGKLVALAKEREDLQQWASANGVERAHTGWIGSQRPNVGEWAVLEEEPQYLLEESYPLYPLVPRPGDETHAGQSATIYFGLVPAGGLEVDALGLPRYDDDHLYEIRCFVRRHRPSCPRTRDANDCNGELFWSRPTEPFRLASHFDPVGTSHRPVNVKLPDFPSLAAQAASRPVGALSPVRMTQPPRSSLQFSSGLPPTGASVGEDAQICFLAIPLITIVASFVLNLFLPIVTFLFGLWFLLRLKFCLPPSIEIAGGIEAELAADAQAGIDIDVGVSVAVAENIHDELKTGIAASLSSDPAQQAKIAVELDQLANKPLAAYAAGSTPQKGPDFAAGIAWEQPIVRAEAEVLVV